MFLAIPSRARTPHLLHLFATFCTDSYFQGSFWPVGLFQRHWFYVLSQDCILHHRDDSLHCRKMNPLGWHVADESWYSLLLLQLSFLLGERAFFAFPCSLGATILSQICLRLSVSKTAVLMSWIATSTVACEEYFELYCHCDCCVSGRYACRCVEEDVSGSISRDCQQWIDDFRHPHDSDQRVLLWWNQLCRVRLLFFLSLPWWWPILCDMIDGMVI